MSKNRIARLVVIAIVVVLAATFAVSAAEAQGPGTGRGQGSGGRGQGQGQSQGQSLGFGAGQGSANMNGTGLNYQMPAASDLPLTDEVIAALTAGLQDEYNAYNTYQAVIDQFGAVRPFTNIQAAEAQHIASLEFLFDRYGLTLPESAPLATVPQFTSLADACQTGADAEVANFGLYDQMIAAAENYPDISWVFTSLRNASEFQHLPAFERCAG